jgi:hypothetical protein
VPGACESTVRPRQHCNGDEGANKCKVKQHPDPAELVRARATVLLDAAQQHRNECVQRRGSEDAFDGAIGSVDAAALLDVVHEAGHASKAVREGTEGDDGGDELETAGEAQKPAEEGGVSELGRDEACEKASRLGVLDWIVERGIVGLVHCGGMIRGYD